MPSDYNDTTLELENNAVEEHKRRNTISHGAVNDKYFNAPPSTYDSENFLQFCKQVCSLLKENSFKEYYQHLFVVNGIMDIYLRRCIKESHDFSKFLNKICKGMQGMFPFMCCQEQCLSNVCYLLCYNNPLLAVFLSKNIKSPKSNLERKFKTCLNSAIEHLDITFYNKKY